jgi:hypothetical protein
MKRYFNVTGACNPQEHYMVNLQSRLSSAKSLVDRGMYFTINRARQYGKTTTLYALEDYLKEEYLVINIDFQMQMSNTKFENEKVFSIAFAKAFLEIVEDSKIELSKMMQSALLELEKFIVENKNEIDLVELFRMLSKICAVSDKPIVLMIDEIDSATNNQIFLDFLAQLRGYYLRRRKKTTFHSVILASVYDVKNIQLKIRPEEEHKVNSPWNIATDFTVEMSFSVDDIAGMITEYESDHQTGMDIDEMANLIYEYTSGYPFLVSKICKLLDETENLSWIKSGFLEAIKILLNDKNTLFESLINKLADYPQLRELIYVLLFNGQEIPYNALNKSIEIAEMFGFVKNECNKVVITNRIFETVLYNFFLSEEITKNPIYISALQNKNQFIEDGRLNMKRVLEKFVETFDDLYGDKSETFLEDVGRRYFMLFLKPIINGVGNSYVEARTRDMKRTDIVVDYRGEQFVIELKIWHGSKYHKDGEQQILEYLDFYHLKKGYMLTFNFNKSKEIGVQEVQYGDKILVEAVV